MKFLDDLLAGMVQDAESDRRAAELRMNQEKARMEHHAMMADRLRGLAESAGGFDGMTCYEKILFLRGIWRNTTWSDPDELRDVAESVLLESIDDGSAKEVKTVYVELSECWVRK